MKEVWELYGQTWSHYGGSKSFLVGGILAIILAAVTWVTPSMVMIPMFLLYTCGHAVIQYKVLTMKHEGLTDQIRTAMIVRGARLWWWFVGFTTANGLLELYIRYFQQAA